MIVIIDYGIGNLHSVAKAVENLGAEVKVSSNINDIENADKIILPGVGAFSEGIKNLKGKNLIPILEEQVLIKKKPFLGICLGMQLIAEESSEGGINPGLAWLPFKVKKFESQGNQLKVPHVGWEEINCDETTILLKNVKKSPSVYFVHSFYLAIEDRNRKYVIATCNYGTEFAAAINHKNIFATQFHPEKSQTEGLKILENFINL